MTLKNPDLIQDIADMHAKFGVNPVIRGLDPEKLKMFLKFRIDFLNEEYTELVDEFEGNLGHSATKRADNTVDALIDLIVVAIGTLDAMDVDIGEAWNRVHTANMAKDPGVNPKRPNPLGLPDMIKPEGWTAPTHADNVGLIAKVFVD